MRCFLLSVTLILTSQAFGGNVQDHKAVRRHPLEEPVMKLLRSERIVRLQILCVPKEIATRADLTPRQLERICNYKIDVRDFQTSVLRGELISTLEKPFVEEAWARADFRWGCIFYDAKGSRVLTMYFDGFGQKGLINGVRVTSVASVVTVLERRCSCLWE